PFFSLNPYSRSAEFPWLSLQVQSCFIQLLDLLQTELRVYSPTDEEEHQPKRCRLQNTNLQNILDEISQYKSQKTGALGSLQRLAFYLNSFRITNISFNLDEILALLKII